MKPNNYALYELDMHLSGLDEQQIKKYKEQSIKNNCDIQLRSILLKSGRTYEEIIFIYEYLSGFSYFKKIKNEYGQECLFRIAQYCYIQYQTEGNQMLKKYEEPTSINFLIEGKVMRVDDQYCSFFGFADVLFEECIINLQPNKSYYVVQKNIASIVIDGYLLRSLLHKFQLKKQLSFNEFENEILNCLSQFDKLQLYSKTVIETFFENQYIFKLGDQVKEMYFIIEGQLKIGKSIGQNHYKTYQQQLSHLLADYVKEKQQMRLVALITKGDIFGFEEFISKIDKRQTFVVCASKTCKIAKIPVELFFRKYNQIFNLIEYNDILSLHNKRTKKRNQIHNLQLEQFKYQQATEYQESNISIYETLESQPFENQIRSKPRSIHLENSILLPDDTQFRSISVQQKQYNNLDKMLQFDMKIKNNTERKRDKISTEYQVEKKLITNQSFDKSIFIKKNEPLHHSLNQKDCKKFQLIDIEQPFSHIQFLEKKSKKLLECNNQVRFVQNSKCSHLPSLSPLYTRLGKVQNKNKKCSILNKVKLQIDKIYLNQ